MRIGKHHRLTLRHREGCPAGCLGPKLGRALAQAGQAGHAYLVINGTLIPIDRVAASQPSYSGKHHRHGMNLQVIASPDVRSCGRPDRFRGRA